MKEIEVKDFGLHYDGMYHIIWQERKTRVYIELHTILKMLQIEGLSFKDIDSLAKLRTWNQFSLTK